MEIAVMTEKNPEGEWIEVGGKGAVEGMTIKELQAMEQRALNQEKMHLVQVVVKNPKTGETTEAKAPMALLLRAEWIDKLDNKLAIRIKKLMVGNWVMAGLTLVMMLTLDNSQYNQALPIVLTIQFSLMFAAWRMMKKRRALLEDHETIVRIIKSMRVLEDKAGEMMAALEKRLRKAQEGSAPETHSPTDTREEPSSKT